MWLHSLHVIALPGVQVVSLAACGCLCCVYWLDVVFENACDHLIRTTSFGLCNGHPGRLTIKHKNQQVPCWEFTIKRTRQCHALSVLPSSSIQLYLRTTCPEYLLKCICPFVVILSPLTILYILCELFMGNNFNMHINGWCFTTILWYIFLHQSMLPVRDVRCREERWMIWR